MVPSGWRAVVECIATVSRLEGTAMPKLSNFVSRAFAKAAACTGS